MKLFSKSQDPSRAFSKNAHIVDKIFSKHSGHHKQQKNEMTTSSQPSQLDFTNGRTANDLNAMGSTYSTKPKDNYEPNNRLIKRGNALEKTPYNGMRKRKFGSSE